MHQKYMQRALELAAIGRGSVSPNPMVRCVIVHNGLIIGEGWHKKYGDWHAEVNAVNSVVDKSLLAESTVYVTLEPCSHFGKTPPCADLLVKHQVKKVVICNHDPFPLVAGRGIEKLQVAGIEVITGVLEDDGRKLNARFFKAVEQNLPYIILKWAESADGFMAAENYQAVKISNEVSHTLVHKWRSEEDAIMVGTRTAHYDNPRLNVRKWSGKNPVRVVIDKNLSLSKLLNIFGNSQKTLIYNTLENKIEQENEFIKLDETNFLLNLLQDLATRKIQSVLVEGGTALLQSFIDAQLFDEIRVFKCEIEIKKGVAAPLLPRHIVLKVTEKIDGDVLFLGTK